MADNLYGVSGGNDLLRVFSLGLSTVAITGNDTTGTNGSFQLLSASSGPVILAQPQDQRTVSGSSATFSVNALGVSALGYQWHFNGANLTGASTSVLTITNVLTANAGSYEVVVTNTCGSATSALVTLSLSDVPVLFAENGIRLSAGTAVLQLTHLAGQGSIVLEASSNLSQWGPILTNPPAFGQLQLIDPRASNFPQRYYRVATP